MDHNMFPEADAQPRFLQKDPNYRPSNLSRHLCNKYNDTNVQQTIGLVRSQAGNVIAKIEHIFESLADCVLEKKEELVIQLKTKTVARNYESESEKFKGKIRNITFPSKNPKEAWKFTVLIKILELSHEALVTGVVTTKRDIYYRQPKLFKQQSVVDRYLNDIAHTFGVERDALNVVAAAKGLVAGPLIVIQDDCSSIDFSLCSQGVLVPSCENIKSIVACDVRWILVIEKEATFRSLTSSFYWKYSLAGKGIVITAKGYPDILTCKFLHLLSVRCPKVPIYALMDFDPDGICIMKTYKYGSLNRLQQKKITAPLIKWLGVKCHHIWGDESTFNRLQKLSARDRKLATNMLQRDVDFEWKQNLQYMLMLNYKAEIQILGGASSLGRWLDSNLLDQ